MTKKISNFGFPHLLDTLKSHKIEKNIIWLERRNYEIIYLGKYLDSIYIFEKINNETIQKHSVYGENKEKYKIPNSGDIEIIIDTSKSKIILDVYY